MSMNCPLYNYINGADEDSLSTFNKSRGWWGKYLWTYLGFILNGYTFRSRKKNYTRRCLIYIYNSIYGIDEGPLSTSDEWFLKIIAPESLEYLIRFPTLFSNFRKPSVKASAAASTCATTSARIMQLTFYPSWKQAKSTRPRRLRRPSSTSWASSSSRVWCVLFSLFCILVLCICFYILLSFYFALSYVFCFLHSGILYFGSSLL